MKAPFIFHRRRWLRLSASGLAVSTLGSASRWLPALASDAASHPGRRKSVILVWLAGGPSTIDLWDLKPGHENGGPFREIETATAGVRIGEHLPKLARWTPEMAVVRSLISKEGDHGRATQFVKTGYAPQGAIQFPALGALVAHEFNAQPLDLPAFISIDPVGNGGTLGGGFIGPRFSPLVIGGGASKANGQASAAGALSVPDLKRPAEVSDAAQTARLDLVASLNEKFGATHGGVVVDGLQAAAESGLRLMQPAAAAAFRLEDESDDLRAGYGRGTFAQGCLLARRLVEHGVPFVEVALGGWDTHQNNFQLVKDLAGTLDTALAALLADLKGRGLLEDTLVVCMGEFGRTPKINRGNGRDHWPQSWAAVLAGGGIRGGQSIGKTTADGMAVEDRPVTVPDLIATVCNVVGIDPRKQNISNVSRPIRIADPAARPMDEI